MKKPVNFILVLILSIGLAVAFRAQTSDADIQRLQKLVDIIGKINVLPIDFKTASAEITPNGMAILQKQAALLKQLPAGTIVEIGVHTFAVGSETANLKITQQRADNIRNELIKLGVPEAGLVARGYGSSKPIAPNTTEQSRAKNRRVEYLIEKMAERGSGNGGAENQPVKSAAGEIVAGRGWREVIIGATREEIEAALGKPEEYYKGNIILPNPSSHHRSKGIIVVYDAETDLVKEIDFVGNASYLDAESYGGPFASFQGKPDKNLSWGVTARQVVDAYAEAPKKRLVEKRKIGEVVTLIYDRIVFNFVDDKLYYVSVAANNDRLLSANADKSTPVVKKVEAPAVSRSSDPALARRLFDAVEGGRTNEALDLIRQGANANYSGEHGTTLARAALANNLTLVEALLKIGADANLLGTGSKSTPLHGAVYNGSVDMVALLLEYGADVNAENDNEYNSLHIAALWNNSENVTALLLKAGADPNAVAQDSNTPLSIARKGQKTKIVELLSEAMNQDGGTSAATKNSGLRDPELDSAVTARDIALLYNKYAREFQTLDEDFTRKVKVYNGLRQAVPVDKVPLCRLLSEIKPAYFTLMQALNKMVGVIESGKLDRIPDSKGNEERKLKVADRRKNLLLLENAIKADSNTYGCKLN